MKMPLLDEIIVRGNVASQISSHNCGPNAAYHWVQCSLSFGKRKYTKIWDTASVILNDEINQMRHEID